MYVVGVLRRRSVAHVAHGVCLQPPKEPRTNCLLHISRLVAWHKVTGRQQGNTELRWLPAVAGRKQSCLKKKSAQWTFSVRPFLRTTSSGVSRPSRLALLHVIFLWFSLLFELDWCFVLWVFFLVFSMHFLFFLSFCFFCFFLLFCNSFVDVLPFVRLV